MYVLPEPRRIAGGRNDAVLVDHFVLNDDIARALQKARAVAVDRRQDRADDAARDAAIVVAVEFGRVVLADEPPAAERGTPLAVGRQRRQPAVRRVDDERRGVRELRAALEPVPRRVVRGLVLFELRLGTLAVVFRHLLEVRLL